MDKRTKDYKDQKKRHETILTEALKRFDIAEDGWSEIYEAAQEDIRFIDEEGAQWDDLQKKLRERRPCLSFDKISEAVDQVVGDMLQNRPGIKIRGAEDDDTDTAEVYEGLIRQIESRGKAYKTANKFSIKGGFGVYELLHDYIADDSMDQDIILGDIQNPFSVLLDPIIQNAPLEKMMYGFKFTDMPKEDFEAAYPDAKSDGGERFITKGTIHHEWMNQKTIRVAQYYRLVPDKFEIVQLSTGEVLRFDEVESVLDELGLQGVKVVNRRMVKGKKLEHFKITAIEVLEEVECIGSLIPLIPVFGKRSMVNGKMVVRGIVRKSKDAQRLYNHERSTYVETVNQVPRQQIFATQKMLEGHEDRWKNMNTSGDPVLPFNIDQGMAPQRVGAMQIPTALVQGMQMSLEDIKSGTGQHNASLGMTSNETSGRAINARAQQGDTATYEFTDELVESMSYAGKIMVQWIPKVYDATRQIRILGEDDAEKVVKINHQQLDVETGEMITLNDLSRGKYDVKVTVGASYATRRVETQEQLAQIMQSSPEMGQLIADLYIRSLDIVGSDEAIKRIRMHLIKQGIAEPNDEEKQEMMEKQAQQQPDPMQQLLQQFEQQRMQLALQKEAVEIAETESKTNLNRHKAAQIRFDTTTKTLVPLAA